MSYKFNHTLETTASAQRIWEIWTDVANWSRWDTELLASSLEGEFTLGAKGMLKPKKGFASKFVISEFALNQNYTFTTQLPLCKLKVKRYLTEENGLSFTHEVSFEGLSSALFSSLLGKQFREALPKVMENIKRLAE